MRNLLLAVFVLACAFSAVAQNKHPFTFEDMMALKRVEEPVSSPDGKWVLFAAVDVDLKANTKTPHIWVVPLSGNQDNDIHVSQNQGNVRHRSGEREIISDQDADRPRWARDGKRFAFVSTKENGSQIWIADFDSSTGTVTTTHRLTNIATEADGELWSPDGKNILFKSDVDPECDGTPESEAECNAKKLEEKKNSKVKVLIFTHLLYRHWNAYKEGKRSHLLVIPAGSIVSESGEAYVPTYTGPIISGVPTPGAGGLTRVWPRDLTPGDYDAPVFSLGGQDNYAFSPDGHEICYASNHDPVPAISTDNDLFTVPVNVEADATSAQILAQTKNITADNKAADETPLYSSEGTDRWVGTFTWAPDSWHVYFSYEDRGSAPIAVTKFRHWGNDPESRWLISTTDKVQGFNDDLVVTPDGRTLLFTRMSLEHPNEMYKVALPLIPLKQDEKPYR